MLRLVVVEDDPKHLPWLEELLGTLAPLLPCEIVQTFSDWEHALSFLGEHQEAIDVVITDLQDRESKKFEGLRVIRLAKQLGKSVVAVSSFLDDPAHMREVLRSGSDFYVKKPFKPTWRKWDEYPAELERSAELSMYFALRRLSVDRASLGEGSKHIFLSYAGEDRELASEIREALGAVEIRCFMAARDLATGSEWEPRLREMIVAAAAVVLLITPRSFKRAWVLCEAGAAWGAGKPIFPAVAYVPVAKLPALIRKLQAQEIETAEGRRQLIEAIRARVA